MMNRGHGNCLGQLWYALNMGWARVVLVSLKGTGRPLSERFYESFSFMWASSGLDVGATYKATYTICSGSKSNFEYQ